MSWWSFRRVVSSEPTIKPLSSDNYRFTGHDESKAVQSRARRQEQIDKIRREAAIETVKRDHTLPFLKRARR